MTRMMRRYRGRSSGANNPKSSLVDVTDGVGSGTDIAGVACNGILPHAIGARRSAGGNPSGTGALSAAVPGPRGWGRGHV